MLIYGTVVVVVVVLASAVIIFALGRKHNLDINTASAVVISAAAVTLASLAFPYFLVALFDFFSGVGESYKLDIGSGITICTALLVILALAFMFASFISSFISTKKAEYLASAAQNGSIAKFVGGLYRRINMINLTAKSGSREPEKTEEEKLVDSRQNIDTMGLEAIAENIPELPDAMEENRDKSGRDVVSDIYMSLVSGSGQQADGKAIGQSAEAGSQKTADAAESEYAAGMECAGSDNEPAASGRSAGESEKTADREAEMLAVFEDKTDEAEVELTEAAEIVEEQMEEEAEAAAGEIISEESAVEGEQTATEGEQAEAESGIEAEQGAGEEPEAELEEKLEAGYAVKENATLEECIDEAFRLKGNGDLEGAILYYMYALDKKPETDAVFWIILDICSLYKELGQTEFARNILEDYMRHYGSIMDKSIRVEIEKNLL